MKEIIESNEVYDDSFGVIVSMHDGLIVNTSNSIHKSMGYPKDMWQGRSFIDFIHSKDRISFISYVTSVLTDPCTISRRGMLKYIRVPILITFKNKHIVIFSLFRYTLFVYGMCDITSNNLK